MNLHGDRGRQADDGRAPAPTFRHIEEDDLFLYVFSKGLTVAEMTRLREHLGECELCRNRLLEIRVLIREIRRFHAKELYRRASRVPLEAEDKGKEIRPNNESFTVPECRSPKCVRHRIEITCSGSRS